jgi:flagellar biosynthesis/type III secretory pathway protein FliH
MAALQLLPDRLWPVHAESVLLLPDDLQQLHGATTLAQQCQARCAALLRQASDDAQALREQATQQGLAQGLQQAALQTLRHEQARAAQWQQREQELVNLVLLLLDRVAPALQPGELVSALARQAVSEARHAERLMIEVHPSQLAAVQAQLQSVHEACPWLHSLQARADDQLPVDDCVLRAPTGHVRAGWAVQRAALEALLRDSVGQGQVDATQDPAELAT